MRHFGGLPFAVQLPGIAALVLVFGTLAPWETEHEITFSGGWIAGADLNLGQLTFITGVIAVLLTVRVIRSSRPVDSGGLAAAGLLAVVLVAIDGIRIHDASASIGWGLYVAGAGAVGLLLGGLILLGAREEAVGPPD
jgi:hypothetical protein